MKLSILKDPRYSKAREWVLLVGLSAFFVLFVNYHSIITGRYFGDLSVWELLTRSWKQGALPYRDFFDHKGILFYMIYQLAALIKPFRVGIMILSIVNLSFVWKLILLIIDTITPNAKGLEKWLPFGFTVVFFATTFFAAHMPEEFSLLFILIPLYLTLKVVLSETPIAKHPLFYSVIYGICAGAITFIKANTGFINAGLVVGFIILLLRSKAYKALLLNAVAFIAGFIAVALPILLYTHHIGILDSMIECYWKFNLIYRRDGNTPYIFENLFKLAPAFFAIFASLLYDYSQKKWLLSLFIVPSSLLAIFMFIESSGFIHYFMTLVPLCLLSIIYMYKLFQQNSVYIVGLLLFSYSFSTNYSLCNLCEIPFRNIQFLLSKQEPKPQSILKQIPDEERDDIYAVNVFPITAILENQIFSITRFRFGGEKIYKLYPDFREEIDNFHNTTNVKWIITSISLTEFQIESYKKLMQSYDLIDTEPYESGTTLYLYRRKTEI